jgi:DNA-binding CsgD family transcriptional regulator
MRLITDEISDALTAAPDWNGTAAAFAPFVEQLGFTGWYCCVLNEAPNGDPIVLFEDDRSGGAPVFERARSGLFRRMAFETLTVQLPALVAPGIATRPFTPDLLVDLERVGFGGALMTSEYSPSGTRFALIYLAPPHLGPVEDVSGVMGMGLMHMRVLAEVWRERQRNQVGAVSLTPRQMECLKWTMIGKTSWEVSQITGMSERTVNAHLTDAARRLGVHGRSAAVLKAQKLGLLRLE